MRVVAYTALHYGSEYLAYAIRSIIDHVDAYYVLYAAKGSHGSRTSIPCPDTREQLYAIAQQAAGDKLVWVDGDWTQEGQQRDYIHTLEPDADVVLVLDADEIWGDGLAESVITQAWKQTGWMGTIRNLRLPIIHYWRSFYRCVLRDPAYPVRAIFPHVLNGEGAFATHRYINHMGYAQRAEIVQYKILTHGHKGEWRQDVDWLQDRFMVNAQMDCHPVGSTYWNPERVDPLSYMPRWMQDHPYYQMSLIE